MRRYKVIVSDEARKMLKDHVYFLARVNAAAARELRDKILREISSLETMPERFPYLDEDDRRSRYRKMAVPNWYLVIYLVMDDTVYVEYILDGRKDYPWLFRQ